MLPNRRIHLSLSSPNGYTGLVGHHSQPPFSIPNRSPFTTVRLRSQHPSSPQDYHQVKTSVSLRIPCASILYADPFPQHHGSRKTYAGVSNKVRDIRIRAASVRDTAGNAAHGFKHRNEYEEVDHFEVSTSCFAFRYQDIRPESGRGGGMYALHV